MTKNEMFLSWLNDAYAMEQSSADLLNRYSEDVEEYKDIKDKFAQMANLADQKSKRIKSFIEDVGGEISTTKNIVGKFATMWQSVTSEFMHDQPIKHMLVVYSALHLAIASYTSLAAAAQELGQSEIVMFAQEYCAGAREQARWFENRIPSFTTEFLQKEHTTA